MHTPEPRPFLERLARPRRRWLVFLFSLCALPFVTIIVVVGIVAAMITALPPSPPRPYEPPETSWLDRPGEGGITPRPFVYAGAILAAAFVCHELSPCRDHVLPSRTN